MTDEPPATSNSTPALPLDPVVKKTVEPQSEPVTETAETTTNGNSTNGINHDTDSTKE